MAFDPDQFLDETSSSFDPDKFIADTQTGPQANPVTAATTGLIHGAGLGGWAERIGAGTKTAMDAITGTVGPLAGGGGDIQDLIDDYNRGHEKLKSDFAKAAAAHPKVAMAGNLAGGVGSLGLAGPAAMSTGGLAATGALQGAGAVDINSAADIGPAAKAAGEGAASNLAFGKAAEAAAPYLGKALAPIGNAISSGVKGAAGWIGDHAADLAEKATGATGSEASKFRPGTGRELLDRKIVNFGSSPENIAENANAAMEKSGEGISDVLDNKLKGTTVDRNTVLNYIRAKIKSLAGDDSQTDLVKSLNSKMGDIEAQIGSEKVATPAPAAVTPDYSEIPPTVLKAYKPLPARLAQMGEAGAASDAANLESANAAGYDPYNPMTSVEDSQIPIADAEQIKRGYQSKVNWKSPNPDVVSNNANTTVSDAYRQSVEDAATQADPAVADQFKADKETYGVLSPVAAAAERRTSQLKQSPHGGLLGAAHAGVGATIGAAIGGPVGAIAGSAVGLGVKALRPRYASMGAVSADKLSQVVAATPHVFGKFASVLKSAAARGSASLGATDYILQQTDPEYRSQRSKAFSDPTDDQAPWMLSESEGAHE